MMNQDNPYAMNQTCKVCGEPAAGFHFGAFTCEGCKSFFGRSYNNLSSISDCKNNGECIINKKNRTACKACRLRKCLMVGMSKSGSRYGRRSNWFKIHCLLQEQQQQAAAAMAAHHNSQQQQQAASQVGHPQSATQKSLHSVPPPPSAAAVAAFGMLGHAGAYPSLYQPRTKEEMMMLGLEEYAKHPAASPSVSSPDSHNSDSSLEVNFRSNALLQLANNVGNNTSNNCKDINNSAMNNVGGTGVVPPPPPPQLRKDLQPFLPLPFPGFPVMPPPGFVPPSHLLFPGYHPALYQHHQGLLKPSPEQQQAAVAAAAVQHLFNATVPNRFTPPLSAATAAAVAAQNNSAISSLNKTHEKDRLTSQEYSHSKANNTNEPNGENHTNPKNLHSNGTEEPGTPAASTSDEMTKRFYLDAVLKSQRKSPPPTTTKLPSGHSKQDYSISALVTPNSESGRDRLKSRQSNNGDDDDDDECGSTAVQSNANDSDDCGEDLVVSMTPPRSPALQPSRTDGQDIPIDLSMKASSSNASSVISKCSSNDSINPDENLDNGNAYTTPSSKIVSDEKTQNTLNDRQDAEVSETHAQDESKENIVRNDKVTNHLSFTTSDNDDKNSFDIKPVMNSCNNNNNNNNNNNICNIKTSSESGDSSDSAPLKRKSENDNSSFDISGTVKRIKIEMESIDKASSLPRGASAPATTTPLDLSAKV